MKIIFRSAWEGTWWRLSVSVFTWCMWSCPAHISSHLLVQNVWLPDASNWDSLPFFWPLNHLQLTSKGWMEVKGNQFPWEQNLSLWWTGWELMDNDPSSLQPRLGHPWCVFPTRSPPVPHRTELQLVSWLRPIHCFTCPLHPQCFLGSPPNTLLALESCLEVWFWGKSKLNGLVGYDFLLSHSGIFQTHKANLGRIRLHRASQGPSYLIRKNTFSSFMGSCTVITLFRRANSTIQVGSVLFVCFLSFTHGGTECCMVIHSSMNCNLLL